MPEVLNPEQLAMAAASAAMQPADRSKTASTTSEYSIQVNMDEELSLLEGRGDKKKERKKEYKRKKKEKRKEEEQCARIKLAKIIKQIYQGSTNFQSNQEFIESSLALLVGGEKFHMFLNEAIKIQVKNMQKDIWDFTQSIIKQNSLEKNSDDQEFYQQMVEYIYKLFRKLQVTSQEIERIINLFMKINANSEEHRDENYGLDRSTFRFLIDSDQSIKNLLKICKRRISSQDPIHAEQIRTLAQMISRAELDEYDAEDESTTTSFEEEQQELERCRKKRRKVRVSDFNTSIEEVVKRLNQMVIIDDSRGGCQATEEWASGLKQRFKQ